MKLWTRMTALLLTLAILAGALPTLVLYSGEESAPQTVEVGKEIS